MATQHNSTNPFASPMTAGETVKVESGSFEIQGERIVGTDPIILPHVCVKCGATQSAQDSSTRRKKDLYWVHPAIFVLVIQLLIFLIVYLVTRRKCHVEYSLCRECNAKQRINIVYSLASLGIFIGMIALMVHFENAWLSLGVIIAFVVMLTFIIRAGGPLTVKAYKEGEFQLRGASPEFLQVAATYAETHAIPAAVLAEDGRLA
ncbi:hypothetical protein AB1K70_10700 [Bremerella sp. JC770]|uniref:hypothetical protein n=1 Tax=Bremerella sp. JC770 TaxID=3232137 RepID=UPI00345B24D6